MQGKTVPEILREAAAIFNQRSQQYGPVLENFTTISETFRTLTGIELSPFRVAQLLLSVKLGRIAKNKFHEDSYMDLAVYACICVALWQDAVRDADVDLIDKAERELGMPLEVYDDMVREREYERNQRSHKASNHAL